MIFPMTFKPTLWFLVKLRLFGRRTAQVTDGVYTEAYAYKGTIYIMRCHTYYEGLL